MMKGKDSTDATGKRAQPMVHPAEIQHLQAGADDRFFQF
jgi:hypothetical protein